MTIRTRENSGVDYKDKAVRRGKGVGYDESD